MTNIEYIAPYSGRIEATDLWKLIYSIDYLQPDEFLFIQAGSGIITIERKKVGEKYNLNNRTFCTN